MDWQTISKASVAGVPLIFVIIGLVYWAKSFTRKDGSGYFCGNDLLVISMGIGLLLGGGYMVYQTRPPAGDAWILFGYWFTVVIYGILMGLVASGLYNIARDSLDKLIAKLTAGTALSANILTIVGSPSVSDPSIAAPTDQVDPK
jgi:hypothetical protein